MSKVSVFVFLFLPSPLLSVYRFKRHWRHDDLSYLRGGLRLKTFLRWRTQACQDVIYAWLLIHWLFDFGFRDPPIVQLYPLSLLAVAASIHVFISGKSL